MKTPPKLSSKGDSASSTHADRAWWPVAIRATSLLLAGVVVASLVFLPSGRYLVALLGWIETQGVWGPVLVAAIYVVACVFFVPGSILTLGAGFLFGPVVGTITVSIGSTLGATLAFLIGRTLARGWIEQKAHAYPKFRAIDRAVGRQGFKIVLLTRLSPVLPFNFLNYAFGLTKVSLRDYVLASWIGMLPGAIMYVLLGSAAKNLTGLAVGHTETSTGQQAFFALGLVVTLVVIVYVTRVARKALDEAIDDPAVDDPAIDDPAVDDIEA